MNELMESLRNADEKDEILSSVKQGLNSPLTNWNRPSSSIMISVLKGSAGEEMVELAVTEAQQASLAQVVLAMEALAVMAGVY